MSIDSQAVADYLKEHPEFFEDHADWLADVRIAHPHEGHAIPIAERQLVALREKNRQLETKFAELLRYGGTNDLIGDKLHRVTLALFAAPEIDTSLEVIYHSMHSDFDVPRAAVRLWGAVPDDAYQAEFTPVSHEMREYAASLAEPYCGPLAVLESKSWLEEDGETLNSFAYLPLRTPERTIGVLALGSPDPARFAADMGTHFLMRLAEVASMAIARYLPAE
ncbi:MAG: DUF484 family protein [Burkholderiales bacterium]|nr:DUF484 family protein [Betaproteobacteria bacterium]MBK8738125.1 DUF484 family protein [Betaproteobacteria bacterium]MBK9609651.1 DUF484 family protein [Betaproteobacteria bacterium]MBP8296398.1 DUF484 family protein [Burkholderiales bacterium]